MIKVTVELCPLGDESKAKFLGAAIISNDGTGTKNRGHYDVVLSKWTDGKDVWKKGKVRNFKRVTQGPWDLLYLALKSAVGYRQK